MTEQPTVKELLALKGKPDNFSGRKELRDECADNLAIARQDHVPESDALWVVNEWNIVAEWLGLRKYKVENGEIKAL